MNLRTKKLHPAFGAEIFDLDLRQPLGDDLKNAIEQAAIEHGLLLFRNQPLSEGEQVAFSRSFGDLDIGFKKASKSPTRFQYEELLDMSNVSPDNQIVPRDHQKIVGNIANQLWHSDSSFQKPASSFSFLLGIVIPPSGGDTEFVDTRVAYEALSDREQADLEGLEARHHPLYSRLQLGDDRYSEEQQNAIKPVVWPIVRAQPETGRRCLFIGAHAHEVLGMTVPEGRMLLQDLLEHTTHPDRVYRHQWQVGDLIIWDNRTTLHRGRRFNFDERRELRRTTVLDPASQTAHESAA